MILFRMFPVRLAKVPLNQPVAETRAPARAALVILRARNVNPVYRELALSRINNDKGKFKEESS
jgi:hypothetical protein